MSSSYRNSPKRRGSVFIRNW